MRKNIKNIREQVDRMINVRNKLLRITRYETNEHDHRSRIIDIEKSTE